MPTNTPLLSTAEVCQATGASYRQLDWWERTGVLDASVPARGTGTQRAYSPLQARVARVLLLLSQLGADRRTLTPLARQLLDAPERTWWASSLLIDASGALVPWPNDAAGYWIDPDATRRYVDAHMPEHPTGPLPARLAV